MSHPIQTALSPLHLLRHPFYVDWMAGTLTASELKDYACQYFSHVDAFPRYLSAVHSRCLQASQRKVLLENLNDEEGLTFGLSHPELWLQFAAGMGASREEVRATSPRPAIQDVIATFFRFAQSSFHEGLGALYAYECQIPEIAESKIKGLKENYHISDPHTLEFFEVHRTADIHHREVLESILDSLGESEKTQALAAATELATKLWNFLSDVHQRQMHAA